MFRDNQKQAFDVLQEATIGDCWNMDGDQSLPEPWIGVTRFALLKNNPPEGRIVGARQLDEETCYYKNITLHIFEKIRIVESAM